MRSAVELRRDFDLDPAVTHLNHGAYGTTPRQVHDVRRGWQERCDANPHRFNRIEAPVLIAQARADAATFMGVAPDGSALVRNVSEAVSTVLSSLDLEPGDEVILGSHGYGAVRMAIEHWCSRRGAVLRQTSFAIDADDASIVGSYAAAASPRTRLAIVDQITSPTAAVLPVRAIVETMSGVDVLVDAAHVPGTLPVDIEALGAAFWVGNLHKWAYAIRGTALLWVSPSWRDRLAPLVISWLSGGGMSASFDYPGTLDYSGWLSLAQALDYWRAIGGWERIDAQRELVGLGQQIVAGALATSLDGLALEPAPTMRLVRLPDGLVTSAADVDRLYDAVSARGVEVAPVLFEGRGYVRVAAAAYTEPADYERLSSALTDVLG